MEQREGWDEGVAVCAARWALARARLSMWVSFIAVVLALFAVCAHAGTQLSAGVAQEIFVCAPQGPVADVACDSGGQYTVWDTYLGPGAWVGLVDPAQCDPSATGCGAQFYAPMSSVATEYPGFWVTGWDASHSQTYQSVADFASTMATQNGSAVVYLAGGGSSGGSSGLFDGLTMDDAAVLAAAVMSLWGLAFGIRALIRVL